MMNNEDSRLTIIGCFRYSLGRMTYMPSHTINMIKENIEVFNAFDLKLFIDEIREADSLGMYFDKIAWLGLVDFLKIRLEDIK